MNKKNLTNLRVFFTTLIVLMLTFSSLCAQEKKFLLHPVTDSVITAAGLGMLIPSLIIKPDIPVYDGKPFNTSSLNAFDRLAVRPYSRALDLTGDVFMAASIVLPAVLFSAPKNEWLTIGIMYAESVLFTYALTDLTKTLVNRNRPYLYFENPPSKALESGDAQKSFFSRHTALAFNGAAFASYVFSKYFPDSLWKIPVTAGSYAFAASTAVIRVAGGSHFLSDVLTGAVVGTASGLFIPMLHKATIYERKKPAGAKGLSLVRLNALPGGIACRLEF